MNQLTVIFCAIAFTIAITLPTGCDAKSWREDMAVTLEEKKILDKFKDLVEDRLPHDYMKKEGYLIRWLRKCYFNIQDAEIALMDHVKWTKDNNMDTIMDEDWSVFEREYRYNLESRDKEGRPILYFSLGNWDVRKASIGGYKERFPRFMDKVFEETCSLVRDVGDKYHNVSQAVIIVNVDGFNMIQHGCLSCISNVLQWIGQYDKRHPGCAEKLLIINVPRIAEALIKMASAALHPITRDALVVYGTNKRVWEKVVKTYIDVDQLPRELGGTLVYTDGGED